jgi:hypothetical protein
MKKRNYSLFYLREKLPELVNGELPQYEKESFSEALEKENELFIEFNAYKNALEYCKELNHLSLEKTFLDEIKLKANKNFSSWLHEQSKYNYQKVWVYSKFFLLILISVLFFIFIPWKHVLSLVKNNLQKSKTEVNVPIMRTEKINNDFEINTIINGTKGTNFENKQNYGDSE